jgi:molybdenum cofactor cytidylyltransferase
MVSGILLAAGAGSRFGGQKLLYPLADGTPIGVAAARNLRLGVGQVIVEVRPDSTELSRALAGEGAEIVYCKEADKGMAASLACGVRAAWGGGGWVIALADMPWIRPETIQAVASLIEQGASLAAPCYQGQRGHPVGMGREFRDRLMVLEGDAGARALLISHAAEIQLIHCNDPGVVKDVDVLRDVAALM